MMVSTATRLCNAGLAGIFLLEGDIYKHWTGLNVSEVWREHERQTAIRAGRGTDLSLHSHAKLSAIARQLNERPRKTLLYQTPAEKFAECVAAIG
jgi:hypothetical protein